MHIDIMLYLLCCYTFMLWVGCPLFHTLTFMWRLPKADIKFIEYEDQEFEFNGDTQTLDIITVHRFLLCEIWVTQDLYYEWRMSERGDIFKFSKAELTKPKHKRIRNALRIWKRRKNNSNDDSFMKFRLRKNVRLWWPLRKYIESQVSERLVMAKIAGFKKYRLDDYVRRS